MWEKHQRSGVVELGEQAPDFHADSTDGDLSFHDWIGDSWVLLLSHPADFTPICTTELGLIARVKTEFESRNTKILGLSVDTVETHRKWILDIEEIYNVSIDFPILEDPDQRISRLYGLIHRNESTELTIRSSVIIDPQKRIRLFQHYPLTVGRNIEEILRVIDALQAADRSGAVTPANWYPGDKVLIPPHLSDPEATEKFPHGWRKVRDYFRVTELKPAAGRRDH